MGSRIDHLEDRLRALSGALRLRGVWQEAVPVQPARQVAQPSQTALRLRGMPPGNG